MVHGRHSFEIRYNVEKAIMPKTKAVKGQKQNSGNQHTVKAIVPTEHLPGRELMEISGVPEVLTDNPYAVAYWHEHAEPKRQSGQLNADTMPLFVMLCAAWGDWMDWKRIEAKLRKNRPGQRGKVIVNGEKMLASVSAREIPAAEKHFANMLTKFEEIGARYAKPQSADPWDVIDSM